MSDDPRAPPRRQTVPTSRFAPSIRRLRNACVVVLFALIGCGPAVSKSRDSPAAIADTQPAWFEDATESTQLTFTHQASGAERFFFPAIMGSGAAFVDYDLDGDLDIVLLDGGPAGDRGGHSNGRLFRHEADDQFVEVSDQSGLRFDEFGMGVAVGDVSNDGYPDLVVTGWSQTRLFVNDRLGHFVDVSDSAGVSNPRWGTSVTFLDYDRDGWLDLFVTNYVDYDSAQACLNHSGQQDFCNPAMFPRTADKLFRNITGQSRAANGSASVQATDVRFDDVSVSSGIALKSGAGLGVVSADFNDDGWPDLYVANDGHANCLWINQRNGTFRDEAVLAGVAYDGLGNGQGSMGIAIGDTNRDQRLDLLVTNLDGESNALYVARPDGGFDEMSVQAKLAGVSFPRTGFGTALFDVDHDGHLDLLVANGRVRRHATSTVQPNSALELWPAYAERNDAFRSDGREAFVPIRSDADAFLAIRGASRALVTGDVDSDGDLDVLVTTVNGPARLLRNVAAKSGHWLMVRCVLPQCGGRDALGARVTIISGQLRWVAVVAPAASYLSSHDPRLHFGLGQTTQIDRIEVVWPDGHFERFAGGAVDRLIVLEQGQGESP